VGAVLHSPREAANHVPPAHTSRVVHIKLPSEDVRFDKFISMDIGGSLSKVAFFEAPNSGLQEHGDFIKSSVKYGSSGMRDAALSFPYLGGTFHFLHFHTARMDGALKLIKSLDFRNKIQGTSLVCTG
jgi:hypothetical protein